jgi:large subunit ribosomal protein L24
MAQIKLKIKKGDTVIVTTGRDKGTKGEVLQVNPAEAKVLVKGVNTAKKHNKPSQANPQGGITTIERPIHISNVSLADPKTGKPSRVGYKVQKDGTKTRIARASGQTVE